MRQSYFPSTDAALVAWARNMSQRLAADYAAFGITQQQSDDFAALTQAYAEAHRLTTEPNTRIGARTVIKNETREAVKKAARLIVSIVRGQASVNNAQKIELGITVPAPRRRAIPRPQHAPTVSVTSVSGHTVHLRLGDSQLVTSRARPGGVRAALIFTATGDAPPKAGSSAWRFHAATGRMKCDVRFPHDLAPGTKVWISAVWVNSRNQAGPACAAMPTYIQFGGDLHIGGIQSLAA